jgi:hypothetical protein
MKMSATLLALAVFASPAISYFKYHRPVQAPGSGQHFFAVDKSVWKNARPDLGDLRLCNGPAEHPYALVIERGSLEHDHRSVRVLQQATVAGKTQFFIDMQGVVEYDHIDLNLAAKNFVAHAKVEGQDDLHGPQWAALAEPILYDLSRENLGENTMLRLPLSTYKYLRVTIDGPVKPLDVVGASSEFRQEQKAVWRDLEGSPKSFNRDHDSVRVFDVPQNMPVERVSFDVDPNQPNFRREVEIRNGQDVRIGSGEISKVHMIRNGNKVDAEDLNVDFSVLGEKTIQVIIHNGDDQPLRLRASLQQHERRIYFDAPPSGQLTLYYGDEKLEQPVYDYAKLFQQEKNSAAALLGTEESNAAYTGRPDERPWTERHPAVLWIAIIAAVLVLGALALRSMKTAAAS